MKKIIGVIISLFLSFSLFAAEGALWGEKHLKVASTEWFDIVYPESCKDSAEILYENADNIYNYLADMYGMKIPCRMPVTLTKSVELYNAYYTSGYYNRIVLYIAPPAEECNVETDNLLKTFEHELTHAYTYNLKTGFWRGVGKIFGDAVNPSYVVVTSGMAEGATLTAESSDGEGRLNDEFAKQSVKQAKIEGKFPKFNDVQGSRDIYPSGSFYYFNGAFHKWLQDNYGMEKYAAWWFRCVNFKSVTVRRAFKKVYGFKLLDAWQKFKDDYEVPQIPADPVKTEYVQDFFAPQKSRSIINEQGGLPVSLTVSEKGLTYVDDKLSAVYFVKKEDFNNEKIKPKWLFADYYIETARQSCDGKYIAVSAYSTKDATYRYYVHIYNTEAKNWYYVKEKGIKNASIVKNGDDYYLVGLSFHGEDWKIRISKLETRKGKIAGESEPVFIDYDRTKLPDSFVDLKNGTFAYILKDKLEYSICIADLSGNILEQIKVPYNRMVIRYLSYCDGELYFSWTKPESMPRLGKLNLASKIFSLSHEDFSGGVYYPNKVGESIIYSGHFYTSNRIFRMTDLTQHAENLPGVILFTSELPSDEQSSEITTQTDDNVSDEVVAENATEIAEESTQNEGSIKTFDNVLIKPVFEIETNATDFDENSTKYNPFHFMLRGLLIPYSIVESEVYDPKHIRYDEFGNKKTLSLPIGLTYYTSNPWGAEVLGLSSGYSYETNSAGYNISIDSAGTDTSLFKYTLNHSSEFDRYGWKQSNIAASVSSVLRTGRTANFTIQPYSKFHIGRSSASDEEADLRTAELIETESQVLSVAGIRIGEYECVDMTNYIYNMDQISFSFRNVIKTEDTMLGKAGIILGIAPYYVYNATLDGNEVYTQLGDVSFYTLGYIPRLLPFKCIDGFCYNLPTKIMAGLFSANVIGQQLSYAYYIPSFAYINFETILYSQQIQKAIPGLPFIYVNDIRVCISGNYGSDYNTETANDSWRFLKAAKYIQQIKDDAFTPIASITLKATIGAVLCNFGSFANANAAKLDYFCAGNFIFTEGAPTLFKFSFGIDTSF